VVEHSLMESSRSMNAESIAALRLAGLEVSVAVSDEGGRPIAQSRARQRELAREMVTARRPAFIWMLDDDLRMERLHVTDGVLMRTPWKDPLGALHDVARGGYAPAVLVGSVHGDPPIPAMATWASRVTDLAATLEAMIERGPHARWRGDPFTASAIATPDFYYDYGDSAVWSGFALWTPRRGALDVQEAMREMLDEARFIPDGAGFTRPIVGAHFDEGAGQPVSIGSQAQVRGGNTVFFDVEACLAHEYPAVAFEGISLRRSDSVGLLLLAKRGVATASSDLALLHVRDAQVRERPDGTSLARHLVADTLGAALWRAVLGADRTAISAFLAERVARIDASLGRLALAIEQLDSIYEGAPKWAKEAGLDALMDHADGAIGWLRSNVPGLSQRRIPEATRGLLRGVGVQEWIAATAIELCSRGSILSCR